MGTIADGRLAFDVTPDQVREGRERMREHASAAGRDPDVLTVGARAGLAPPGAAYFTPDRPGIRGERGEMLDQLRALAEAGVDVIELDLATTMDEQLPLIEWLGSEATPALAT